MMKIISRCLYLRKGLNVVETNLCVSVGSTNKEEEKNWKSFLSENEMKCTVNLLFPLSTHSFVCNVNQTYDISIHVKNVYL